MSEDLEFIMHAMQGAWQNTQPGEAEDLVRAVEDFLLALRQGVVEVRYAEGNGEDGEYGDDGVFITQRDSDYLDFLADPDYDYED